MKNIDRIKNVFLVGGIFLCEFIKNMNQTLNRSKKEETKTKTFNPSRLNRRKNKSWFDLKDNKSPFLHVERNDNKSNDLIESALRPMLSPSNPIAIENLISLGNDHFILGEKKKIS